jgi:hypothetical protein
MSTAGRHDDETNCAFVLLDARAKEPNYTERIRAGNNQAMLADL